MIRSKVSLKVSYYYFFEFMKRFPIMDVRFVDHITRFVQILHHITPRTSSGLQIEEYERGRALPFTLTAPHVIDCFELHLSSCHISTNQLTLQSLAPNYTSRTLSLVTCSKCRSILAPGRPSAYLATNVTSGSSMPPMHSFLASPLLVYSRIVSSRLV